MPGDGKLPHFKHFPVMSASKNVPDQTEFETRKCQICG